MNRADKMLSVLQDGQRHSRRDIFQRVGFMLTNNAASELRAQGFDVQHSNEGRVDFYQLTPLEPAEVAPEHASAASSGAQPARVDAPAPLDFSPEQDPRQAAVKATLPPLPSRALSDSTPPVGSSCSGVQLSLDEGLAA